MDQIDLRIINALKADGRISMSALAESVGLSKTPVVQRLRKLEKNGVILGYGIRVDHNKFGLDHVAFVHVTLSDTRSAALLSFNKAVRKITEIEQCHMTAGEFDYLLKVRTRDIAHYRKILGEVLSALPHVSHTSTFVVMEAVKEN
jgi:Lrp/AsnC family leucine-responsive transcriptional regulator